MSDTQRLPVFEKFIQGLRAAWNTSNRLAQQRISSYVQKLALVTALNQNALLCAR